MKKTPLLIGVAVVTAFALPAAALAQGATVLGNNSAAVMGQNAAGSSVCPQGKGAGFIDADGNGACDNQDIRGCQGANYTDTDNDGVCDNRGTDAQGAGCGGGFCGPSNAGAGNAGAGNGYGQGNAGQGANYTDADGDGVCDNAGSTGCPAGKGAAGKGARNA